MAASYIYKTTILTSVALGSSFGFYNANNVAKMNYSYKKNLTSMEKFGECFCYGAIITSGTLIGGMLGFIYGYAAPISIPLSIMFIYKNNSLSSTF